MDRANIDYYNNRYTYNDEFFKRLNIEPCFEDLKVMDVGCGHGALCIYAAQKGAKRVLGIDISDDLIDFANENLNINHLLLKERIEFKKSTIQGCDEFEFDIITSNDSFEHIIDLDDCMKEMIKRLKVGGLLLIGFGTLYNTPYGDHGFTMSKVPWGHLLRSEKRNVKRINKSGDKKISSMTDMGLNMWSAKKYKKLFFNSGLEVLYFDKMVGYRFISKILKLLSKVPVINELFTLNMYCVLKKV